MVTVIKHKLSTVSHAEDLRMAWKIQSLPFMGSKSGMAEGSARGEGGMESNLLTVILG